MSLSRHLQRTPYICASCTQRLATLAPRKHAFLRTTRSIAITSRPPPASHALTSHIRRNAYTTTQTSRGRLRIAIIGSGPAGFYTAHRLLNKDQDAVIDMYERLPVPYGLVRFGVAPDHPEVKNCQDTFEEVATSPRFTYIGNVRVGTDVQLKDMKPHYDAMLFSYGASEDRELGIEGENSKGVLSARSFVGWYNGLPQFADLNPDLKKGEQAVVIGQGNVALDVARILLNSVDRLQQTDISEQALQTLADSRIKSVRVVGRRGPIQAAFTVKEARELMHIPDVAFEPIDRSLYPSDIKSLPRVQKRIADVLLKGTPSPPSSTARHWALDFLLAPHRMNASASGQHLSSITFTHQRFSPESDPFDQRARVVPTSQTSTIETSLAFRSVGYKSTAIPGLEAIGVPFDEKMGIIPNDAHGRVISPSQGPGELTAGHVHGLYCAGWVKRGPTGVIASTMMDAFSSADIVVQDWENDVPFLNGGEKSTGLGWDGVKGDVKGKGVRALSWSDWKKIDKVERERGREKGKEREKFVSVEDMLSVLD